jgi:hypothetical protein
VANPSLRKVIITGAVLASKDPFPVGSIDVTSGKGRNNWTRVDAADIFSDAFLRLEITHSGKTFVLERKYQTIQDAMV